MDIPKVEFLRTVNQSSIYWLSNQDGEYLFLLRPLCMLNDLIISLVVITSFAFLIFWFVRASRIEDIATIESLNLLARRFSKYEWKVSASPQEFSEQEFCSEISGSIYGKLFPFVEVEIGREGKFWLFECKDPVARRFPEGRCLTGVLQNKKRELPTFHCVREGSGLEVLPATEFTGKLAFWSHHPDLMGHQDINVVINILRQLPSRAVAIWCSGDVIHLSFKAEEGPERFESLFLCTNRLAAFVKDLN